MPSYAYQDDGIEFLRRNPRALLGDEPGLGKSRQALLAAEGRTLIVAPAMIHDMHTWHDEIAKWRPELDATLASYHDLRERVTERRPVFVKDTRTPVLDRDGNPRFRTVVTYEARLDPAYLGHWDTVIFDEAHYLKNRKAKWTEAARMIDADRTWLLTGTPIPNWAYELFTLLRMLRPEDDYPGGPLGSYWRWVGQWFEITPLTSNTGRVLSEYHTDGTLKACTEECYRGDGPLSGGCEHWAAFREAELGSRWLRRLRDDVLTDLPELTGADDLHEVPMVPAQKRAYDALKKDLIAVLREHPDEPAEKVVAWSKPGLQVKLRKVSTALEAISETGKTGSGKLDVMCELLQNRSRPALVVAHFTSTLDAIEARLTEMGLRWVEISGRTPSQRHRQRAKERFQACELDVMVGQVDTVAEGLNLTAGDMLIIVEHSWRPDKNLQVMRRLHRPGQTRPVTVVRLVSPGIDANMQGAIAAKTDHQIRALPAREYAELL